MADPTTPATDVKIMNNTAQDAEDIQPNASLQSNDVVEIHAFLERRTSIEAKVQQFEAMPPIDVFAGVDILPTSSARITSLPSRDQLDIWTQELDRIEAEMERFELGDMIRLKELAKSKSEQKMSPEDTDLIDVTLTTLLAVDKLFHLLRARSETLDMLNLRLQWEDQRVLAWETMDALLEELMTFFERTKWTVSLYDDFSTGFASDASVRQSSPTESKFPQVLSQIARGERRKLGDGLLGQAKQIMSRVHNYKHDLLPKSGATLDKMIDASSKKVPDPLLDEQDKLENKSMVFEGLDKFIPSLHAQWKKADEFYAELKKDQAAASVLIEELDQVHKLHPSPELAASFLSRSSSLASRLSAIGHPSTIIPRPLHHLSPDQALSNDATHVMLSEELASAIKLSRRAELKAKQYNVRAQAVERASTILSDSSRLRIKLEALIDRLTNGSGGGNDALPPRLDDLGSLEIRAHSSYIALLPSLLQDLSAAESDARNVLKRLSATILELRQFNASSDFLQRCRDASENIIELVSKAMSAKAQATNDVDALRAARSILPSTSELHTLVSRLISELLIAIDADQWTLRRQRQSTAGSPDTPLPILTNVEDAKVRVSQLISGITSRLSSPLEALSPSIPKILHSRLQEGIDVILADVAYVQLLIATLNAVRIQRTEMERLSEQATVLGSRISDLRESIGGHIQDVLHDKRSDDGTSPHMIGDMISELAAQVNSLVASLPTMVSFVSSQPSDASHGDRKSSPSRMHPESRPADNLHRKLSAIDQTVRADLNSMALTLSSGLDSLKKQLEVYNLAGIARVLDARLGTFSQTITEAFQALSTKTLEHEALIKASEEDETAASAGHDEEFEQAITSLDESMRQYGSDIISSMELSLSTLRDLRTNPGAHNSNVHEEIINPRAKLFEDTERRAQKFPGEVAAVRSTLMEARRQTERLAYQARLTAEREEMLRRGSLSQAELEAARNALKASEVKAQAAMDEFRRQWEEEQAKRKEAAAQNEAEFSSSSHLEQLKMQIASIRAELNSIGITAAARSPSLSGASEDSQTNHRLPSFADAQAMRGRFNAVSFAFSDLPSNLAETRLASEVASLKSQIDHNHELLARVERLGLFSRLVDQCDSALSDLLEHIDSFPYPPLELQSTHISDPQKPPHEQLDERVLFCQKAILRLNEQGEFIADDQRVKDEISRIEQTWVELAEMCKDVARNPHKNGLSSSRSTTSLSSVASASQSSTGAHMLHTPLFQDASRSRTSSSSSKPIQSFPQRRLPSNRPTGAHSRTLSRSSTRSVSGPSASTPSFSPSVTSSTHSSRQRTMSNATAVRVPPTPTTPRARKSSAALRRTPGSPTPSALSSSALPRGSARPARPFVGGTLVTPRRSGSSASDRPKIRRSYVANPKNKLDVAVGSVVNKLPAEVHIEAVTDTWKDESGKYWIGDAEPKLCFCRILRSQMVMVRVGGGWVELSKFIRDHFAHMFRVGSVSPTSMQRQTEEKWLSSTTLLENMKEEEKTPLKDRPSTPSRIPVLLTPSSRSPQGKSNVSPNTSPLAPLQYVRRAAMESSNSPPPTTPRPSTSLKSYFTPIPKTESKSPSPSPLTHIMSATPSRPPRWR